MRTNQRGLSGFLSTNLVNSGMEMFFFLLNLFPFFDKVKVSMMFSLCIGLAGLMHCSSALTRLMNGVNDSLFYQ